MLDREPTKPVPNFGTSTVIGHKSKVGAIETAEEKLFGGETDQSHDGELAVKKFQEEYLESHFHFFIPEDQNQ